MVLAAATGCVRGPVDLRALEARYPGVTAVRGQFLDYTTPYVWPRSGQVTYFLCRWPTNQPITVALSSDASPKEAEAIEAALRAWEDAGLGVRFQRVAPGAEQITIGFEDESVETATGDGVGITIVDCRLASGAEDGDPMAAALSRAWVRIARRTPKLRGEDQPLTPTQIAGVTLHELGHALGFQGHVYSGNTAMVRSGPDVSKRGAAVMRGDRVNDPTLEALYNAPPGAVVRRVAVEPARTEAIDRLAEAAQERGLQGPVVRVGDRDGRVLWRDVAGNEYAVTVVDVARALREPESIVLVPDARARALLARGSP